MKRLFKKKGGSKSSRTSSSKDEEGTDGGALSGWGQPLVGPSAPPARRVLDSLSRTYDVVGELTVSSPRQIDHQSFFGRMSMNFPHSYQGDVAMKPFHTTIFAALVSGLKEGKVSHKGWIYSHRLAECVTFQGQASQLPQGTSVHFKDTFVWQYRGDSYTWVINITWTLSHMPGIPLHAFLPPQVNPLLEVLGVTTVWNKEQRFLTLID
ncbi:matrix protein [Tahe rhabdovirus 1]|uniref:Matrix protein n=1 Tax=Tahe rhabdovirus 1 TaxID=2983974 RepID=A0A977TMT7_9RHAB|nr:matrix protein [Tahe rhabdovirus 1]UXX18992.1 matrix protein [Tahe rhabdovirus 1]UXX19002.1 matrix protein [Tahe rhabdovirus 1]